MRLEGKVANIVGAGQSPERDKKVPLLGKMGTAWDVANAALFLA
jgi:hypothetical protein